MTTIYSTPVNIETANVKPEPEPKKRIELVRFIDTSNDSELSEVANHSATDASDWDNLRLVIKGDPNEFDVIAAWDNDSSGPNLYLGHWNDGVVG